MRVCVSAALPLFISPFPYQHGKEASASPALTALPLPLYVEEHLSLSLLSLPSSLSLGMEGNGAFVLRSN